MFITAVCVLFLIKLRWPNNKSLYLKYIQEMFRCTSYNLSETSIQVFLKFYFNEKHKWLCTFVQMFGCVVRSRGKQHGRLSFMVNWIPRRHFENIQGKSKCTTGVTTLQTFSASIYTSSLSRTVIVVHIYRCFAVWCRGKETNIAARTDFIDELLQLKSLQMRRNK